MREKREMMKKQKEAEKAAQGDDTQDEANF